MYLYSAVHFIQALLIQKSCLFRQMTAEPIVFALVYSLFYLYFSLQKFPNNNFIGIYISIVCEFKNGYKYFLLCSQLYASMT